MTDESATPLADANRDTLERSPGDSSEETPNHYAVIVEVGHGGMGTVYLCANTREAGLQRLYAMKLMHEHLARDENFVHMFLDEARLAARIHHRNVVSVLDLGLCERGYFVIMDYVEGCSLSQLLKRGRECAAPRLITPILVDTLLGLHAAHTLHDDDGKLMRLVHRDVSPGNILVSVQGLTRITDFGVAKAASRIANTRPGVHKGKLAYMAPEQLDGLDELDARADIFALGVVMWTSLTGRPLYSGPSDADVLRNRLRTEIAPPSIYGAPACLDAVCLRALAREPNDRFQSAREMASELRRVATANGLLGSPEEVGKWAQASFADELEERREAVRKAATVKGPLRPNFPPPPKPACTEKISLFGKSALLGRTQQTEPRKRTFPLLRGKVRRSNLPRLEGSPPEPFPAPSDPQVTSSSDSLWRLDSESGGDEETALTTELHRSSGDCVTIPQDDNLLGEGDTVDRDTGEMAALLDEDESIMAPISGVGSQPETRPDVGEAAGDGQETVPEWSLAARRARVGASNGEQAPAPVPPPVLAEPAFSLQGQVPPLPVRISEPPASELSPQSSPIVGQPRKEFHGRVIAQASAGADEEPVTRSHRSVSRRVLGRAMLAAAVVLAAGGITLQQFSDRVRSALGAHSGPGDSHWAASAETLGQGDSAAVTSQGVQVAKAAVPEERMLPKTAGVFNREGAATNIGRPTDEGAKAQEQEEDEASDDESSGETATEPQKAPAAVAFAQDPGLAQLLADLPLARAVVPGKLIVTSVPQGAKVYLDGSLRGTTPAQLDVKGEGHSLALVLPGHKLYLADVLGSGVIGAALERVKTSHGPGHIKVRCRTKDRYYLFVDGRDVGGLCPMGTLDVATGAHVVEAYDLIKQRWRTYHINVKRGGENERIYVK